MNKKALLLGVFLFLIVINFASAVDFYDDITNEDKETFDEILEPVMRIYNFAKYSATIISVVILLFAGTTYMGSGNDPAKREKAKSTIAYVALGLIIVWGAPLIVQVIVG